MMSPEMMQMAMEQMRRMSPEQMQAMMSSMKDMDPAMMQAAMRQMQGMSPADMEAARRQVAGMDPSVVASQAAAAGKMLSQQQQYAYSASMQLKAEGNKLHSAGKFSEAADKYRRAKGNLEGMATADAAALRKACVLNLGSCYLNLGRHQECVAECGEVLKDDPQNLKALYRRGQAYAALQRHQAALDDLQASLALSAHDPPQQALIREKLQAAKDALAAEQQQQQQRKTDGGSSAAAGGSAGDAAPAAAAAAAGDREDDEDGRIEEVVEERRPQPAPGGDDEPALGEAASRQEQLQRPQQRQRQAAAAAAAASAGSAAVAGGLAGGWAPPPGEMQQMLDMMRANPGMLRQAQQAMASMPKDQLMQAMRAAGMPPGMDFDPSMMAAAAEAAASMSPEQLQQMADMAQRAQAAGVAPPSAAAAAGTAASASPAALAAGAGGPTAAADMASMMTPEMMKMAADMMSSMKPEDMAAMAKMAEGMGAPGAGGATPTLGPGGGMSDMLSNISPAMVESMLNSMRSVDDGTLKQMMLGMCGGDEQKAEAMAAQVKNITPGQARMLATATGVVQGGVRTAKAARQWLASNVVLVAALVVLLVAVLLRWYGIM